MEGYKRHRHVAIRDSIDVYHSFYSIQRNARPRSVEPEEYTPYSKVDASFSLVDDVSLFPLES